MLAGPDNTAITSAIINLAKSLGLRVIADGVENEEQSTFLRQHQCDEMPGHVFSEPLLAAVIAEMFPTKK